MVMYDTGTEIQEGNLMTPRAWTTEPHWTPCQRKHPPPLSEQVHTVLEDAAMTLPEDR